MRGTGARRGPSPNTPEQEAPDLPAQASGESSPPPPSSSAQAFDNWGGTPPPQTGKRDCGRGHSFLRRFAPETLTDACGYDASLGLWDSLRRG